MIIETVLEVLDENPQMIIITSTHYCYYDMNFNFWKIFKDDDGSSFRILSSAETIWLRRGL